MKYSVDAIAVISYADTLEIEAESAADAVAEAMRLTRARWGQWCSGSVQIEHVYGATIDEDGMIIDDTVKT